MTKSESREIEVIRSYVRLGMDDNAARALSALVRAARTTKSRNELLEMAGPQQLGYINHPAFII